HGYPLDDVLHRFVTLRDTFDADLERGAALIREWLPRVAAARRTARPLSALKLGLQCGGSDAFSGISGNPLAAWVARELIRHGGVIAYGERMRAPGYYFMDSPGNDLESIAGQVASGSNFLYFVTGNGSITNFPFVPTIKIVTTTGRYRLLSRDMDVNAGAYLDGVPMDELGRELLERTIAAA